MPCKNNREWLSIASDCYHEIPLDELEDRLEMQRISALEPAVACYTDFCPSDCTVHCGSGYSGCSDLCACDGAMCAAECGSLCAIDTCVVDII